METPKHLSHYNLSVDYALLWELICEGFAIVGFIYDSPHWQIMKIDKPMTYYSIRVVGSSYGTGDNYKDFLRDCQNWHLHFIIPHNEK